ncbi:hypothetical protein JCM5296_003707 [Sporobolomyces johnsonii]
MEPTLGQRDWSAVTELLNGRLDGRRATARPAELEHLKTRISSICEGFRPVWNAQSPQVQGVVINALSLPPDSPLPSLEDLISDSNARWAQNKPVISKITDIPKPGKSAFRRPEFKSVMECFQGIVNAVPRDRDFGNFRARLNSLESVLFRSWEALSDAEIQAAGHVVGHIGWELTSRSETDPHQFAPPKRNAFVTEITKAAAPLRAARTAALNQLCADAEQFANRASAAKLWWDNIDRDLRKIPGGWDFLDNRQCHAVSEFMSFISRTHTKHRIIPEGLPGTLESILLEWPKWAQWLHLPQRAQGDPPPSLARAMISVYHELTPRQAARYRTTVEDWREGRAFE